ncbi:sarcosine oxidase subunit beta [Gemmobacter megaterium]|uniref:Sarcosine oxidase subunit beta n=1 Tax=Gemmobacter megaterium TaxID=1086013 RepID=A0A1N7N2K1_9RHOB|nr:FAD-dependent oxidoreductase [Gemmobacter megaterium]GGE12641.1 FAD-binding oxidoreductase [Gemmobacter megaterium]SIS92498.1 sarcosine oxidase subunit beta [Gemmobacter megaterium]
MIPAPAILRHRPRVCIIGGGIVGASAALFLAMGGAEVTLFERDRIGSHASGVNFGGVRRHARLAGDLPLSARAHHIWHRLPELLGHDCDLETPGHLKLAETEDQMAVLEAWLPIGRNAGMDVRLLGRAELARRFPWLGGNVAGGSFCTGDGFANPRLVAPAFARAARRHGATIHEICPVRALTPRAGGGWRLDPEGHPQCEADHVILATGAWPLGPDPVPAIRVQAPQMFVTEPVPMLHMPVLGLVSGAIYLRQSVRGNLIFGGGHGIIAPDGRRSRPDSAVFSRTPALLQRLLPGCAGAAIIRSWTGIEAHMPDGLPMLGPSPSAAGLFHAWGFCGHGFQTGPGVGEVLAELILTGQTSTDLSAYDPARFGAAPVRAAHPPVPAMESRT